MWERPNDPDLRRAARARHRRLPAHADAGRRQAQAEPEQARRGRRDDHRRARAATVPTRIPRLAAEMQRAHDAMEVRAVTGDRGETSATITGARVGGAGRELLPTDGPGRRPPRRRRDRRHRTGGSAARRAARCSTPAARGSSPGSGITTSTSCSGRSSRSAQPLGARRRRPRTPRGSWARRPSCPTAAASAPASATRSGPMQPTPRGARRRHRRRADLPDQRRRAQRLAQHAPRCAARASSPTASASCAKSPRSRSRVASTTWTPRSRDPLVAAMARDAASRGVVGLVDLDMAWNEERMGAPPRRRVRHAAGRVRHLPASSSNGRSPRGCAPATPVRGAASDLARVGSLKVITDGSLGTRTAACSHAYPGDPHNHGVLDRRRPTTLRRADDARRPAPGSPARSTRSATSPTPTRSTRSRSPAPSGTIEHAQLVAHADIPRFARLGVGGERAARARDRRPRPHRLDLGRARPRCPTRCARSPTPAPTSLFGSDAPVSPLDPWAAMAAAVFRTRDGREPWQPRAGRGCRDRAGRLDARRLDAPARVIEPGARADLALCERDPLAASRRSCGRCACARRCSRAASPTSADHAARGSPARSGGDRMPWPRAAEHSSYLQRS